MIQTKLTHISGHVQGVGFLAFVAKNALKEGITGHAKNLNTGNVEVIACGKEEAIARLEKRLRGCPSAALITDVTSKSIEHAGTWSGFLIL
jgi:acylphosphatase